MESPQPILRNFHLEPRRCFPGPRHDRSDRTALATDNGSFATVVLNDRFSAFNFTFDDRLDPTSATDTTNYDLEFAEPDGVFDNDDDEVIALSTPGYDGDFMVALPITKSVPEGLVRLTIKGTSTLTDAELNPLNDGVDESSIYTIVDTGPFVTTSTPAPVGETFAPATQFNSVMVSFSEDIEQANIGADDLTITDQNYAIVPIALGDIMVTGNGTDWTCEFPAITQIGQYTGRVGPGITDLVTAAAPSTGSASALSAAGRNLINQNQNTLNGEANDTYSVVVTVTDTPTTPGVVNLIRMPSNGNAKAGSASTDILDALARTGRTIRPTPTPVDLRGRIQQRLGLPVADTTVLLKQHHEPLGAETSIGLDRWLDSRRDGHLLWVLQ